MSIHVLIPKRREVSLEECCGATIVAVIFLQDLPLLMR